jgi:hypothetical protein
MPALSSGVAVEAGHTCPHPGRNQTYCPAGVGRPGDLLRLIDGGTGAPCALPRLRQLTCWTLNWVMTPPSTV